MFADLQDKGSNIGGFQTLIYIILIIRMLTYKMLILITLIFRVLIPRMLCFLVSILWMTEGLFGMELGRAGVYDSPMAQVCL